MSERVSIYNDGSSVIMQDVECDDAAVGVIAEDRLPSIFEVDRCASFIVAGGYERVVLQFPDEMLRYAPRVYHLLSTALKAQTDRKCYLAVLGDTSYGSDCVDEVAAEHAQADAIIHFGEACLAPVERLPVLYVYCQAEMDVAAFVNACVNGPLSSDAPKPVVVLFEKRFTDAMKAARERLPGDASICIASEDAGEVQREGEEWKPAVLDGLHFSVPCEGSYSVVYVTSGDEVPTHFMLELSTAAFSIYNPMRASTLKAVTSVSNRVLKRRYFLVQKTKDADIIGIVVGTLGIANYLDMVKRLRHIIESAGKKAYVISVGKLNVNKLANFAEIDIFVLVAAPSASVIESRDYFKPVVTPFELECALVRGKSWTGEFHTDFREVMVAEGSAEDGEDPEVESDGVRFSLVSGKIKSMACSEPESSGDPASSAVSVQGSRAVTTGIPTAASYFHMERTFKGLDPQLGDNAPSTLQAGQFGIAKEYDTMSSEHQ